MNRDLAALLYELQRAGTPVERARALARAWRTLRSLSPTDRRLLVRDVGFDGAEDLIEGLADKRGGAFSPAAVLEVLGRLRQDETLSLKSVVAGLRDPNRRDEVLVHGIDLAAASVAPAESDDDADLAFEPSDRKVVDAVGDVNDEAFPESGSFGPVALDGELEAASEAASAPEPARAPAHPVTPPTTRPEAPCRGPVPVPPLEVEDSSPWDEIGRAQEGGPSPGFEELRGRGEAATASRIGRAEAEPGGRPQAHETVIGRLRAFRAAIPELRTATPEAITEALARLPEGWARRRALCELVAAGGPISATEALDLIESLDRPMDRRWCVFSLAGRGDLEGVDLERALALLESPAARRRLLRLAAG